MNKALSFLLLSTLFLPLLADDISYYGVRATYSMDTYSRDIMSAANTLFNQYETDLDDKMTFSDVVYSMGTGYSRVAVALMNIKPSVFAWTNGDRADTNTFDETSSQLSSVYTGAKMSLEFSFSWYFKFSGSNGMAGKGKCKVESSQIEIVSDFAPETGSFETRINPTYVIEATQITGNYVSNSVEKWIKQAVEHGMMKDLTEAMEAKLSSQALKHFTSVPNHSYTRNLPVGFEGELYSAVKQGADQIVLSFRTDSVIESRPYRRKVWRSITTDASTTHDLMICMNYQVLADVVEIMGKARGYFWRLTEDGLGEVDGIDYKVSTFSPIFDTLSTYDANEKINIGCRSANPYDVIVQRPTTEEKEADKYNRLQIPMECIFTVDSDGFQFAKIYIFIRNYYTPEIFKNAGESYGRIKGSLTESTLHSFTTSDIDLTTLTEEQNTSLTTILGHIAVLWDDEELCEDGLFYEPLRDMTYGGGDVRVTETVGGEKIELGDACFYYDEQYAFFRFAI